MSKVARHLRQELGEVSDKMSALAVKTPFTDADQKQFDKLDEQKKSLRQQITNFENASDLAAELSQKLPRNINKPGTLPGTIWSDSRTGAPLPLVPAGSSVVDAVGGPREGHELGSLVAGMVGARRTNADIRAALMEGSGPAGGYLTGDYLSAQIIDRLRAAAVCFRAGALTLPLPGGPLSIAKLTSDPKASWRAENAEVAQSDPSFAKLVLDPRCLAVIVKFSRELAEDAANFNQLLTDSLVKSFALELDRAGLFGDATAGQPVGLLNLGISEIDLGTDGGNLSVYDSMLDGLYTLENANAADPTAAVMSPRTRRTFNKAKNGDGEYLTRPDALKDLPFLSTTSVPDNMKHGNASNASTVIMGDFTQMIFGIRTQLQLQVLNERYSDNMQVGILAYLRADVHVKHPESFVKITGVLP